MTEVNLKTLSESELTARFREYALEKETALLDSETTKFKGIYKKLQSIDAELRARGPAARKALLILLNDENFRVRYEAAVRSLAIAPERARAVLQEIADSHLMPEAGDAGMTLLELDRGVFKPT